jgi:flagellar basal-body rod protein FlgB
MQTSVESVTVPLSLALDAAIARQQVIASNVANVHTPGYVAQRATFEVELASAWRAADPRSVPAEGMSLRTTVAPDAAGSVQLDREVAGLAQNSMHYQALIRALNRHFSVLATAVTEGKR